VVESHLAKMDGCYACSVRCKKRVRDEALQVANGLRSRNYPKLATTVAEDLERLKWFLWHGNVFRALQVVEALEIDLDDSDHLSPEQRKLLTTITEFGGYLRANVTSIPNYGERYRAGETSSSAFVESTVNQVATAGGSSGGTRSWLGSTSWAARGKARRPAQGRTPRRASSASRASCETVFPSSAAALAARSRTSAGTRKAICGERVDVPDSDGRPPLRRAASTIASATAGVSLVPSARRTSSRSRSTSGPIAVSGVTGGALRSVMGTPFCSRWA